MLELVALDPGEVVDVALLGAASGEVALVEVQVDRVALVGVADEADELADADIDAQAVEDFALESGDVRFAGFDLAARELPEERQDGAGLRLSAAFSVMVVRRAERVG